MPAWLDISIFAITLFFMLVGLIGLLIPVFPGVFIIWLTSLGYGIVSGFGTLGTILFILISLLMLLGVTIDNILMGAGARKGGAAWITIGLGLIAGVVFTIIFPPIGGLIAAPLTILLIEYIRARDLKKAVSAVTGLAAGWGLSFVARFLIGILMILLWLIWAWKG
jgi:uncharacterized protein YqgC (DUF456 family)